MYLDFFGFSETPFSLSPDPRFIYFSKPHKEVFALLLYGIERRYGFMEIMGDIGTGKTTVLRTLLTKLDEEKYRFALIFNPVATAVDLMRGINREYGIPGEAENCAELLDELNRFLLEENAAGRRVMLIIDEAQNLSPELLEQVRLISSLETDSEKLIQIILAGQHEPEWSLERPELARLNQQSPLRYKLNHLDREDTEGYIEHRLTLAGGGGKVSFSRWALKWLFHYSRGNPRLINILCDRALLIACTGKRRKVTARTVALAVRDVMLKPALGNLPPVGKRGALAIAAVFMVLFGYIYLAHEKKAGEVVPKKAVEEKPALPVVSKPSGRGEEPPEASLRNTDIIRPGNTLPKASVKEPSLPTKAPPGVDRYPGEKPASDELSLQEGKRAALQAFNALAPVIRTTPIGRLGEGSSIIRQLKREAGRRGLEMDRIRGGLDETIRFGVPTLLDVSPKGSKVPLFLALTGSRDGKLSIHPPLKGRSSFSRSELARLASGRVYILWRNNERIRLPLARGDSGNSVIRMQILLQAAGAGSLDVNGVYDGKTGEAVMEFQRSKGLKATGKLEPMTLIQLYRAVIEPSSAYTQ